MSHPDMRGRIQERFRGNVRQRKYGTKLDLHLHLHHKFFRPSLTVEQVRQIATKLSQASAEELRGRYDVPAMTEAMIYPEVWQREGTAALDWLLVGYQRLVKFYTHASSQEYAVVLAIL